LRATISKCNSGLDNCKIEQQCAVQSDQFITISSSSPTDEHIIVVEYALVFKCIQDVHIYNCILVRAHVCVCFKMYLKVY
jgi:hypothetical protein